MKDPDGSAKVAELVNDVRTCMLTTTDADGGFVSRPMAVQETEFDGDLWFFAAVDSRKVEHVRREPQVNAAFASASTWVSVTGTAEVVHDPDRAEQLWNPFVEAWFPEGPRSDGLVLIKVHATTAEYWDTPGGRVATLVSFVKARVSGRPYDGGDHDVVTGM